MFSIKKILLLLLIPLSLESTIIEIEHIADVAQLVKEHAEMHHNNKVLVAFDLCNTLFCPRLYQDWGSDHWLDAHAKRLIEKEGIEPIKAWNALLPIYCEIQGHPAFMLEPVEMGTLEALESIKMYADITIALTARSLPIISETLTRMYNAGISFKTTGFGPAFDMNYIRARYQEGVIFCSGGNKGIALLSVLKKVDYIPTEIIIVDDKLSNLLAIEKAFIAAQSEIKLTLIHYTHLRDVVRRFTLGDY